MKTKKKYKWKIKKIIDSDFNFKYSIPTLKYINIVNLKKSKKLNKYRKSI